MGESMKRWTRGASPRSTLCLWRKHERAPVKRADGGFTPMGYVCLFEEAGRP